MVQDRHVLALNETRLLEALPESAQKLFVLRYGGEDPDHRHRRLLRARRKGPCRSRAADERYEIAPLHRCNHSITSSARASTLAGISMPSAFAVLRLITNSYLVGACTGSSAGFSPLRMRST